MYDSFDHYSRFGDPKWEYGIAQAKTTGRMTLRLANADSLPFEATSFAKTAARYVEEIEKLADRMRDETEEKNRQIRERTMQLAADPTKPFFAPKEEDPVPHIEFAPLKNAVARLEKAARAFDDKQTRDDRTIMRLERALTRDSGLPGRPWYRHHVYAPGQYTGYGVKTMPAVREAIELRKWTEANEQIVVLAKVLDAYAELLAR